MIMNNPGNIQGDCPVTTASSNQRFKLYINILEGMSRLVDTVSGVVLVKTKGQYTGDVLLP